MSDTPTIREMHGLSDKPRTFDQVAITVADPDTIRSWSFGEVVNPETINYRTFKPEQATACSARTHLRARPKDMRMRLRQVQAHQASAASPANRCGVEVIANARVRRERMGHIELAAPVAHIWFLQDACPAKHRHLCST